MISQCLCGALKKLSRFLSMADQGPHGIWALTPSSASSLASFPSYRPEPLIGPQPTWRT